MRALIMAGYFLAAAVTIAAAQNAQAPWTPEISVAVRYFVTDWNDPVNAVAVTRERLSGADLVRFAPDGRHFFFVFFHGDLAKDQNVFELWVYSTAAVKHALSTGGSKPPPLRTLSMRSGFPEHLASTAIGWPVWISNTVIEFEGTEGRESRRLYRYDIGSGKLAPLTGPEYLLAPSIPHVVRGDTILFATFGDRIRTPEALEHYPFTVLDSGTMLGLSPNYKNLRYLRYHVSYQGGPPRLVAEGSNYYGGPWLSPDGRWAMLVYQPRGTQIPTQWSAYEFRAQERRFLIELETGLSRPLLEAPVGPEPYFNREINTLYEGGWPPFWSADGRHVLLLNAALPLDGDHPERRRNSFVIDYDMRTGEARVIERFANAGESVVGEAAWLEEGRSVIVVHRQREDDASTGKRVASRIYRFDSGRWSAHAGTDQEWPAAAAARPPLSFALRQSANEPPRVLARKDRREITLSDADPALQNVRRAPVAVIHWKDRDKDVESLLTLPAEFSKGRPVPLVVQLGDLLNPGGLFFPDGEFGTAFAAQALTAQGFAVLQTESAGAVETPEGFFADPRVFMTPTEGPAQVERLDAAIKMLAARGVIAAGPIGLIGFSRSGYYAYYIATHPGDTAVGAVIPFDSITSSYGQYLNIAAVEGPGTVSHFGQLYGDGKGTFWDNKQAWLDAPEFNLDRLQSPVLFHITGGPEFAIDTIGAFRQAGRPFDYLHYPSAPHQLRSPRQRAAAMQSTVDWMNFWLQGRERDAPDDPGRFARWRDIKGRWMKVSSKGEP